ncbi:MAG: hypothetical protein DRQ55_06435 [Planctomycetota bacterium]|nr:MAG: hypothetical protein DRQ55_06435 [Planctomycetota bacterium]
MTLNPLADAPAQAAGDFASDLAESVRRLRAAFTELLAAIGADPACPQDNSRAFGINRNLSWKLSKIVHSTDPSEVAGHLPGASGLAILLRSCSRHGADPAVCQRVTDAMAGFDQMAARHADDRAGLDMLLSAMVAGEAGAARLEASRQRAFAGNSAIWGVRARLQFGTHIHTPSAEQPGLVDVSSVGGLLDFRRLRPTASWPVARHMDASGDARHSVTAEALMATSDPQAAPLMRDWSTIAPEALRRVDIDSGIVWELADGPVGRTGSSDIVFGRRVNALGPAFAEGDITTATAIVNLGTPVERAQLELLMHRDLVGEQTPEVRLQSMVETSSALSGHDRGALRLPVTERLLNLGSCPPSLASPHAARHSELVKCSIEALGFTPADFLGWRIVLRHPPMPSALGLVIQLPSQPT